MNETNFNLGAIEDFRSDDLKAKDFHIKELVAQATPVNWIEKSPLDWKQYPDRNQDGSSSCVAFSMAKIAGILRFLKYGEFVHYSASSIYNRRSNAGLGMIGTEAFDIARKYGLAPELLLPSENLSEGQMEGKKVGTQYTQEVATISKIGEYVQFNVGDFDTVASTLQVTGKPVMVWFSFASDEWSPESPMVLRDNPPYRHSVVAIEPVLYKGKKGIVIEDSAHFGGLTRRFVSEDFFRARNLFSAYPINLKNSEPTPEKTSFVFNNDLKFGDTHEDVSHLQKVLQMQGLFPTNIDTTFFFGAITLRAVIAFQKKHGIIPAVGYVGKITREKLNNL